MGETTKEGSRVDCGNFAYATHSGQDAQLTENNVVDRIDEYPYPLPTVVRSNRPWWGDMLCVPLTQIGEWI